MNQSHILKNDLKKATNGVNRIQERSVEVGALGRAQPQLLSKHTEDSAGTGDNSRLKQKIEICISERKRVEYNGESESVNWSKIEPEP